MAAREANLVLLLHHEHDFLKQIKQKSTRCGMRGVIRPTREEEKKKDRKGRHVCGGISVSGSDK